MFRRNPRTNRPAIPFRASAASSLPACPQHVLQPVCRFLVRSPLLVAQFEIFLQSFIQDVFQLRRQVRVQAYCRYRIACQNFVGDDS
jgi:hypothetical protein